MRSKTPLVLMEQLIMVLVFAMAAAVCLQVFVVSDRLSAKNEALTEAAFLAQNRAEELKHTKGEALLEWETAEDGWYIEEENYRVEVQEVPAAEGLRQIELQVLEGEEILFEIPVAWQEVSGHE